MNFKATCIPKVLVRDKVLSKAEIAADEAFMKDFKKLLEDKKYYKAVTNLHIKADSPSEAVRKILTDYSDMFILDLAKESGTE